MTKATKTYQATGGRMPVKIGAKKDKFKPDPVRVEALQSLAVIAGREVMSPEDAVPMLKDALLALGMPEQGVARFVEAAIARASPLAELMVRPKTKDFVALIEDRAYLALKLLDPFAMLQASPRDRAIIASILLEKRQLLKGEPTQILGVEERAELDRVLPMLVREGQKRGMTIDLSADAVEEKFDDRQA